MAATPSHRLQAVRAADLLVLDFDFYNLVPVAGELRRADPNAPTYVVMRFPFQHLLEEAFPEGPLDDGGMPLWNRFAVGEIFGEPVAVAGALGSAPSRIAFTVSDEVEAVPASLEGLLTFLATCHLNVVWTAEGPPAIGFSLSSWWSDLLDLLGLGGGRRWSGGIAWFPRPRGGLVEPELDQTAIELPYRLILSPPSSAGFVHSPAPAAVPHLDRVELWHSRLGLAPGKEGTPRDHAKREARAVWVRSGDGDMRWNPDNPRKPPRKLHEPFLASLSEFHRHSIAHLTSNWRALDGTAPLEVERLALSALGGWLDATGQWEDPPAEIPVEEWTNRTALGRDHFVKIVEAGYLFPFGHPASLTTITERKWQETASGRPAALRRRQFIVVREPELRYRAGADDPFARLMPLKRVRLRTLVTPPINEPADERPFLVTVESRPFSFVIEADDGHGNQTHFSLPLVFVFPGQVNEEGLKAASTAHIASGLHRADLGGSPLALVPEDGESGKATFPVAVAAFGAHLGGPLRAGFHPELLDANVRLPAVEIATGKGETKQVAYHFAYREHGLGGGNPGQVFAELLAPLGLGLGDSADKAGGMLSPSMDVVGLSRATGPLGGKDLVGLSRGIFNPEAFFPDTAKLLGLLELRKVLKQRPEPTAALKAPKLVTKQLADAPLVAEWTFEPELQPYPTPNPVFVPKDGARLNLYAYAEAKGPKPNAFVESTLENVELRLVSKFECIVVAVRKARFHAPAGAKPEIDVQLGKMAFVGPLSFVETLSNALPLKSFSEAAAVEVTPERIATGFSIALPDISVGMFALQHVSTGARLELPFTGEPLTVTFNFCARNEPFLLTVSAFGGGGFFLMKVDPESVQRLEASFEFGASLSMNLGVASGGVHVMAGVYFAFETGKGALLMGYFRLGGNVSVLGLISVSIELYLSLSYETESGKAVGRATLTVEIELCLFSTSVAISCERKFAGSKSDPPFEALLAPYKDPDDETRTIDPWADYCRAYA